jgi:hypothetical protein
MKMPANRDFPDPGAFTFARCSRRQRQSGGSLAPRASKATPEELDDYKRFVLNVADKVANAHRDGGETVSADEHAAIERDRSEPRNSHPIGRSPSLPARSHGSS